MATTARTNLIKQLRQELPRLLREDVQVRGEIIGILSEYLTTREETAAIIAELRQMRADFDRRMDELGRRIEEQGKRIEEQGKRIEEQGKRIEEQGKRIEEQGKRIEEQGKRIEEQGKRIEEQGKRIEEQGKRIEEHTLRLASLERTLGAIGARWGILAEEAFREGVRALLATQPELRVTEWRYQDETGNVFGCPSEIQLDVVVHDGLHVLIEIKSSVSAGDVATFARKSALYHEVTGQKPQRLVMISPFVEERARQAAIRLGINIHTANEPPPLT